MGGFFSQFPRQKYLKYIKKSVSCLWCYCNTNTNTVKNNSIVNNAESKWHTKLITQFREHIYIHVSSQIKINSLILKDYKRHFDEDVTTEAYGERYKVPMGPVTRARAKGFKEELLSLITKLQDQEVDDAEKEAIKGA